MVDRKIELRSLSCKLAALSVRIFCCYEDVSIYPHITESVFKRKVLNHEIFFRYN